MRKCPTCSQDFTPECNNPQCELCTCRSCTTRGGSTCFFNGIDPGFANDVLPLVLTSLSQRIDQVRASEIADYSTYYQPVVMRDIFGFARPVEQNRKFISAQTRDDIARTDRFLKPLGNGYEKFIADDVT